MKSGANFAERNRIKKFVASCLEKDEDVDIDYISRVMRIQIEPVSYWVNHFLDELDPQPEMREAEPASDERGLDDDTINEHECDT